MYLSLTRRVPVQQILTLTQQLALCLDQQKESYKLNALAIQVVSKLDLAIVQYSLTAALPESGCPNKAVA